MAYAKVHKSEGIDFHWDSSQSLRYNIKAFLEGFEAEDDSQSFEGYLDGHHSRTELEEAKKLLNASTQSWNEDQYLEKVIEKLLNKLHSHQKGKPSVLYAVLQHAIQESAKKRERKIALIEQEIATLKAVPAEVKRLQDELDLSRKTGSDLEKRYRKLQREVAQIENEATKLLDEARRVQTSITFLDEKITSVMTTNDKLEEKSKLPQEGNEQEKKQRSIAHRKQYAGKLLTIINQNASRQLALTETLENKKSELKKVVDQQKRLEQVKEKMRDSLTDIALTGALATDSLDDSSAMGNIAKFAQFIRKFWRKSPEISSGAEGLVETAHEKKGVSPLIIDSKYKIKNSENNNLREIDVGSGKKFNWDEDFNIVDNMERLMKEYLNSPGYHSPDRIKSAKDMLDKIKKIREDGAIDNDKERDKMLMEYIREQTIPSHGFNKKRSQLQAIYLEADFSYEAMQKKEFILKERERDALKAELNPMIERMEVMKTMISQSESRNISLQERAEHLEIRRADLKEKITSEKKALVSQKAVIAQKRERLLELRQASLTLGIQCNSSKLTPKGEAQFLSEQLSHLDSLNDTTEKMDNLEDEIVAAETEIERLTSDNKSTVLELRAAYHEIRRISDGYEGLAMKSVEDIHSTGAMVGSVETFANALKERVAASEDTQERKEEQGPKL